MQNEGYWPGGLQVLGLINPLRPAQGQPLTRLINFKSVIELDEWGIRTGRFSSLKKKKKLGETLANFQELTTV